MSNKPTDIGSNPLPAVARAPHFPDEIYIDTRKNGLRVSQWGMLATDTYQATFPSQAALPSGAYECLKDERTGQVVFRKKDLKHDNLIQLSGLPKAIVDEVAEFWNKGETFKKLGFLHRRGYLLYGAHGTGKSSLVHSIVDTIVSEGGLVFYCDEPNLFAEGLSVFRSIESNRRLVCIFEDIDAIIAKYGESKILSILDGENQISNVCNIATTNYPELLDKRIVGRPRRFDRVHRIQNLDNQARKSFLEKKLPTGQDINKWVKATEGLSIAAISEVIISVFALDIPLIKAVEILNSLTKNKSSDEYKDTGGMGFDKEAL